MIKTLKDFTQEEITKAKEDLVEILSEFIDEEDLLITASQLLKYLLRKGQEDDKA